MCLTSSKKWLELAEVEVAEVEVGLVLSSSCFMPYQFHCLGRGGGRGRGGGSFGGGRFGGGPSRGYGDRW